MVGSIMEVHHTVFSLSLKIILKLARTLTLLVLLRNKKINNGLELGPVFCVPCKLLR